MFNFFGHIYSSTTLRLIHSLGGGARNLIQKGQKYLYKEILRICGGAFIDEIEKIRKIIKKK